jgi:hypothetical protein
MIGPQHIVPVEIDPYAAAVCTASYMLKRSEGLCNRMNISCAQSTQGKCTIQNPMQQHETVFLKSHCAS